MAKPIDDVDALLEATLRDPNALKTPPPSAISAPNVEKEKEQEREREKEKEKERERERERDRERDREREREREKERERAAKRRRGSRSRSRSRDRHRRRRSRSRSRSRGRRSDSRERERKRRERSAERAKERQREAQLSAAERMAIEAERDSRTVFAFNLPLRAYEDELERFFTKAGKVRDVRLITDRITRKSKGFGYIEFFDKSSIPSAIQMSGTQFMGQTIQVQQTQAEKNRMASTSTSSTVVTGPTKLYVGNLHLNIGEEELKKVFSSCGELEYVSLQVDPETRISKGFGFVQFRKAEDARKALQQVNGIDIAGKAIKVSAVSEKQEQVLKGHITGDLDEDDSQASIRDSHSRAALMQKLAQQRGATTPPPPIPPPPPSTTSPTRYSTSTTTPPYPNSSSSTYNSYTSFTSSPTPCIVLKNMFDPASETEQNWAEDIKSDVSDECRKYGSIVHAYVDKNSQGFVYMKFSSTSGAQSALNALNGRWFAGRQIEADFIPESIYHNRFPESRR